jgi:outer membrane receptor protein involved in Fe transport
MINRFVNVERVEVLRGAQGGLYGPNAIGGVVNSITRQPTSEFRADAELSGASCNTCNASGYLNVPLGEKVATNPSLIRKTHSGYIENLAEPNQYPAGTTIAAIDGNAAPPGPKTLNNQGVRAVDSKLRVSLGDSVTFNLEGDYAKDDSNGNGWHQVTPGVTYAVYQGFAGETQFNVSGNRMVLSPELQGGASLHLVQPVTDRFNVLGDHIYSYIGSYFYDASDAVTTEHRSYSLVNLRAGVASRDSRYGVHVFVNNAFNRFYSTFGAINGLGTFLTEGDPRVIGGTVQVKF